MEQRCKGVRKVWAQSDALKLGTEFSEGDLAKPQILIDDVWGCLLYTSPSPRDA